MNEPRSTLIATVLATHDKRRQDILDYDDAALVAEEFLQSLLAKTFKSVTLSLGHEVLSLHGVLVHFEDVQRVADMAPVLGWFARRDYKLVGKPDDYAEIQRRTWCLGKIKLCAFFRRGGGAGCRYIKVGEEMKPVYKLLCDEAEAQEVQAEVGP